MNEDVFGDPSRRAVESLRGYAYQLYASGIAWLSLADDAVLFVEVAEDYAVAVGQALRGTQVKATDAAITLNSKSVQQAINSLFDLRERNPGKRVTLEFLTTAVITTEQAVFDRVEGEAGLEYWRKASLTSSIEPLRARLKRLPLSKAAHDFLITASDDDVRHDLLAAIQWRCGAPDLLGVRGDMEDLAVLLCDRKNDSTDYAPSIVARVIEHLLSIASSWSIRPLRKADLARLYNEVTRVSVPAGEFDAVLKGMLAGQTQAAITTTNVLEPILPPSVKILAPRDDLIGKSRIALERTGILWLYASSGYGKTTLAQTISVLDDREWRISFLRGLSPAATASTLRRVSTEMRVHGKLNIVLDDLEHIAATEVQSAFEYLLAARESSQSSLIVTSHSRLAIATADRFALHSDNMIEVSDLTDSEVRVLIEQHGGNSELFTRYVFVASGSGHPQLVQALILGLKQRSWPLDDLHTLPAIFEKDQDLNAAREQVRRRLIDELPDDQLKLLARLTLVTGSFRRPLAMIAAEVETAVALPGRALDQLTGSWIDNVGDDRFRPSSLVWNFGRHTIANEEVKRVNAAVARYRTKGPSLDIYEMEGAFLNALVGEADDALEIIFFAIVGTDRVDLPRVASVLSTIAAVRTDQSIYPANPKTSAQIRMAQILLLSASMNGVKLAEAFAAFDRELAQVDAAYASTLRTGALVKVLLSDGAFDTMPGLVRRLAAMRLEPASAKDAVDEDQLTSDEKVRHLFAWALGKVTKIGTFSLILDELANLPSDDMKFLLTAFDGLPSQKGLSLRMPWTKQLADGKPGTKEMVEEYLALGRKALPLDAEIGAAAYETAAVILDEDLQEAQRALEVLDEGIQQCPSQKWSLDRHRARVFFHMKLYERQAAVSDGLVSSAKDRSPIEMTYFLRETAIAKSHLGDHQRASELFCRAAEYASLTPSRDMGLTHLGLRADAAVELALTGETGRAVQELGRLLRALDGVDPEESVRAKALSLLIPHTAAWLQARVFGDTAGPDRHAFVPGMNSQPDPGDALVAHVGAPRDLSWSMLVAVEEKLGLDLGIASSLVSPEWDDRIPSPLDALIAGVLIKKAVRERDIVAFATALDRIARSTIFYDNPSHRNLDVANISRGRLPPVKPEELKRLQSRLSGHANAFIAILLTAGDVKAASMLVQTLGPHGRAIMSEEWTNAFVSGRIELSVGAIGVLGGLAGAIEQNQTVSVDQLLLITLRMLEMSAFEMTEEFLQRAYEWLIERWRTAAVEQAFQLNSPRLAREKIDDIAGGNLPPKSGIAAIALAMRSHIRVQFAEQVVIELQRIANAKR